LSSNSGLKGLIIFFSALMEFWGYKFVSPFFMRNKNNCILGKPVQKQATMENRTQIKDVLLKEISSTKEWVLYQFNYKRRQSKNHTLSVY